MDKSVILKKKAIMEAEKTQLDLSVKGGMNCHYSGKPAMKPSSNRCVIEERAIFKRVGKFVNADAIAREYKKELKDTTRVEYKK